MPYRDELEFRYAR